MNNQPFFPGMEPEPGDEQPEATKDTSPAMTEIVPLFGEVIVARPSTGGHPGPSQFDRMRAWAEAYELWLASRRAENTKRAYGKAWNDFMAHTGGKLPWLVGKADVARWVDSMHALGLSACTVQQRLAAISSFYSYVTQEFTIIGADGNEIPLHTVNPAAGKSLRPKVSPYGKAIYLSTTEVRALLKAIRRDTVQGLRDYALFLTYVFTGRRNSEVRTLRWGDFEQNGGRVWYRWSGKGKEDQRFELPPPAWAAIQAYLWAAGRMETIGDGDYIFTPLTNRATRLPNVNTETWDTNRAISLREVGRLLKHYARKAGLDTKKIHVHTLRHTAAMLRKEAGDDVEKICNFLAHSSLAITQVYLHKVEGQKDESWVKVESALGI